MQRGSTELTQADRQPERKKIRRINDYFLIILEAIESTNKTEDIFQSLLLHYICCSQRHAQFYKPLDYLYNVPLANRLLKLIRESKSEDPVLAVLWYLNQQAQLIDNDDDICHLVSAFVSVYEYYSPRLSDRFRKKLTYLPRFKDKLFMCVDEIINFVSPFSKIRFLGKIYGLWANDHLLESGRISREVELASETLVRMNTFFADNRLAAKIDDWVKSAAVNENDNAWVLYSRIANLTQLLSPTLRETLSNDLMRLLKGSTVLDRIAAIGYLPHVKKVFLPTHYDDLIKIFLTWVRSGFITLATNVLNQFKDNVSVTVFPELKDGLLEILNTNGHEETKLTACEILIALSLRFQLNVNTEVMQCLRILADHQKIHIKIKAIIMLQELNVDIPPEHAEVAVHQVFTQLTQVGFSSEHLNDIIPLLIPHLSNGGLQKLIDKCMSELCCVHQDAALKAVKLLVKLRCYFNDDIVNKLKQLTSLWISDDKPEIKTRACWILNYLDDLFQRDDKEGMLMRLTQYFATPYPPFNIQFFELLRINHEILSVLDNQRFCTQLAKIITQSVDDGNANFAFNTSTVKLFALQAHRVLFKKLSYEAKVSAMLSTWHNKGFDYYSAILWSDMYFDYLEDSAYYLLCRLPSNTNPLPPEINLHIMQYAKQ